jgi:hypothetical protein
MRSVTCGKAELNARRKGAYERLTVHLKDHRKHHDDLTDETFKGHDKSQNAEYKHLGEILSGSTVSE